MSRWASMYEAGRSLVLSQTKRTPGIRSPKNCGLSSAARPRGRGDRRGRRRGDGVEEGGHRAGQAGAPGGGGPPEPLLERADGGGELVGLLAAPRRDAPVDGGDESAQRRRRLGRGGEEVAQPGAGAAGQRLRLGQPEAEVAG